MKTKRVWFPNNTRPVNEGVYLIRRGGPIFIRQYWRFWNGRHWCNGIDADALESPSIIQALKMDAAYEQNVEWCGLVAE